MSATPDGKVIDVAELVDGRALGRFHFQLGLWLFLVLLLDGYNLLAGAYATPAIIKAWSIPPDHMRYLLSASVFGAIPFG